MSKNVIGKYRGIIISVALFLLLDASVLVFNFYVSYQIAEDAVGVNLAGRQRMLSQRMAKSLYMLNSVQDDELLYERSLQELRASQTLFDQTLIAFMNGGEVQGGGQKVVQLKAVTTEKSKNLLREAAAIWEPYHIAVQELLISDQVNREEKLSKAIEMAKVNNLALLDLMNNLTLELEQFAASKAIRLRTIQTLGIVLAILNFLLIMFHFLRQLKESDVRIDHARRETQEILQTVNEGLFLVDRNLIIGEQYSAILGTILGQNESLAGKSFQDILENLINEKDAQTARGFIELLFDPRVKTKLIGDLNPLHAIEINILQDEGGFITKHLRFDFARAYQGNEISHVLITVVDVTSQVKLARELSESREQNESQLKILTSLLHAHPVLLREFIDTSYKCFNRINNLLRSPAKSTLQFTEKAVNIFKEIHNFKGESASLKLDFFEKSAHQMEDLIVEIKKRSTLDGNDFLPFTIQLEALITYTQQVEQLAIKLSQFGGSLVSPPHAANIKTITGNRLTDGWENIAEFVQHIAQRQGKMVKLVMSGLNEIQLDPTYQQQLREICLQLLRNAVVHGIESPYDRELSEKPIQGRIDLRLAKLSETEMELTVMDDGAGLNYEKIREVAIASGRWAESEIESWSNKQLLALLFNEGLSTAESLTLDAGRGVGMGAVMNHVVAHRGKLNVSSRAGRYTRFIITMPLVLAINENMPKGKE